MQQARTLTVDPSRFLDAYNIDISEFIERHSFKESTQKNGKEINYLSYSHAYRLFRTHFPELEVACVVNPETNGFVFREIDNRGYFIKPYVYAAPIREAGVIIQSSAEYYYPVLTVAGLAVYPEETQNNKYFTADGPQPKLAADIQLFNKSIQRAIVKAIALTTGIGLKLWTGDDLSEVYMDGKQRLLNKVVQLQQKHQDLYGIKFPTMVTFADSIDTITTVGKELKAAIDAFKAPVAETLTIITDTEVANVEPVSSKKTN